MPSAWVGRSAMAAPVVVAVALLAATAAVSGWVSAYQVALVAAVLSLPGDIVRRRLFRTWVLPTPERIALNIALSYAVIVVLGGFLALFGLFTRPAVLIAVALCTVAAMATRRTYGPVGDTTRAAWSGFLLLAACGAVSMLLFSRYPYLGDRIFLGQMQISMELVSQAAFPNGSVAFDAPAEFPVHYAFYSLFVGVATLLAGSDHYPDWVAVSVALRGIQLGLFLITWFVVARRVLGMASVRSRASTGLCLVLPVLLFANVVVQGKFREPLVEGFALSLVAVGLWLVLRWPNRYGWREAVLASIVVGLLAGTHLPALVALLLFSGAWFLFAPLPKEPDRSGFQTFVDWFRRAALRSAGLTVATLVGLGTVALIAGTSALDLVSGSAENGLEESAQTDRAFRLMIGEPLGTITAQQSLVERRWTPDVLLLLPDYRPVLILAAVLAAVGLMTAARRGAMWRLLGWLGLAAGLTAAYAGVGMLLAAQSITPANAIVRNTYYIWIPVALALCVGLQQCVDAPWPRRVRARPQWRAAFSGVVAVVLLLGVLVPLGQKRIDMIWNRGWIVPGAMSRDGQAALRWLDDNTRPDARVMMSELTYGSELFARRRIVTEGKATIESPAVTAAAASTLPMAMEFFLPVRSPKIILERDIDYVVVGGNPAQWRGMLGGMPLLRGFASRRAPWIPLDVSNAPYLQPVFIAGGVRIFHVQRRLLPTFQERTITAGDPIPACAKDVCITTVLHHKGRCAMKDQATERGTCLVRTTRPVEQEAVVP